MESGLTARLFLEHHAAKTTIHHLANRPAGTIELRSAEGGDDSKLWLAFTQRRASGGVFRCEIVSELEGEITLSVSGSGAWELFSNEAGGHRWQRVPPTEQNGRRHSSTFTVAVFRDSKQALDFKEADIEFEATCGHGPGGQHRNKTATAIRATHKPTGEVVFIQDSRSQRSNLERAREILRQRVSEKAKSAASLSQNASRQSQIGTGERSDKIRTVQEQSDRVVDHRTNKKCNVATYQKGEIWRLH